MNKPEKLPLYLIKLDNHNLGLVDIQGRLIHGVRRLDATHGPDGVVLTVEIGSEGFDVGMSTLESVSTEVALPIEIEEPTKRYPFDVGGKDA